MGSSMMIISSKNVWIDNQFTPAALCIEDGRIVRVDPFTENADIFLGDYAVFPGFIDVHVHLREPGFLYKETIASGTKAAARGGYTTVFAMPNLNPVPDCPEHLVVQLEAIRKDACIRVLPYGSLTVGQNGKEMADLAGMAANVCAFSDDGRGVQNEDMMRQLMFEVKKLGKIAAAHCEVNDLLNGGYIHDGDYAKAHGHRGICSASEWRMIERDIRLAEETGCPYHVCHISTAESVSLIRDAKKRGVDITCETGPHYLTMCDADLQEDGRFKMNPPLRSASDKEALLAGILDGTIDMIATDHAPHSAEEKGRGLEKSAMGVVGIETAFPVLYAKLVKTGFMSLERLIGMLTTAPAARFGLENPEIKAGARADITVFDLDCAYTVDPADFLSMGRATPFAGWTVQGRCVLTLAAGKIAYEGR
ncbi:MAG: dihydroorotase [Ruminococcaceae bacterium]|nr:dihydroorotase [Oscillospiraceae bacterium]